MCGIMKEEDSMKNYRPMKKKKKEAKVVFIQCEDTDEVCTNYHDYFNSRHFLSLAESYLKRHDLPQGCKICNHWKVGYKVKKSATYGSEQVEDLYPLCKKHWGCTEDPINNRNVLRSLERKERKRLSNISKKIKLDRLRKKRKMKRAGIATSLVELPAGSSKVKL